MVENNRSENRKPGVVEYRNPGVALPVADALTEVLRSGARELVQQAVEAEVAEFVARHRELKDERERQRVVRNGYQPERTIQTHKYAFPYLSPCNSNKFPYKGVLTKKSRLSEKTEDGWYKGLTFRLLLCFRYQFLLALTNSRSSGCSRRMLLKDITQYFYDLIVRGRVFRLFVTIEQN